MKALWILNDKLSKVIIFYFYTQFLSTYLLLFCWLASRLIFYPVLYLNLWFNIQGVRLYSSSNTQLYPNLSNLVSVVIIELSMLELHKQIPFILFCIVAFHFSDLIRGVFLKNDFCSLKNCHYNLRVYVSVPIFCVCMHQRGRQIWINFANFGRVDGQFDSI